jgi:hypothetical protein
MGVNRKCVKVCAKVYSESRKIGTPEKQIRHYVHSSLALLFAKPLIWPVLKMDPAKIGQKLFKFSTLKFKTAALNILRSRDIWLGQSFHSAKHKTLSQACAI